ncbi:MAG: MATE family efflux transporter [Geobacteraceae bacterium]
MPTPHAPPGNTIDSRYPTGIVVGMITDQLPKNELLHLPVASALRRLAIPAGVGFFFTTMFNVVDTFYGGLISTQALAALSLSFPVFFFIIAAGSGVSTGATALIGNALGAGRVEEARSYTVQAISFAILTAAAITAAGLAASPALFKLLGASGDYLTLALSYMNVIFSGTLFFLLNYILNSGLYASGNTRCFRNFLIAGFFLNLGLDPWFLYGGLGLPPLGLPGIALATIMIQGSGNFYLLLQLRKTGLLDGCRPANFIPRKEAFRELARQGFPASLNMLTVGLGVFVITWFLSRFGKDAVAAYGIAARIEQTALLPVMGLNIATLALVAQNNGARLYLRIEQTVKTALKAGIVITLPAVVLVFLFAQQLMAFFSRDPAVIAIGVSYLRVAAFVFCAYVTLYINVFALQGLKKPLFAIWIGVFRQIIAPIPVFFLLADHFGWGMRGIWWGIFLVTWTAAVIALLYIRELVLSMIRDDGSDYESPETSQ